MDIEYHNTLPIQLRFSDADQFGHINNSVFFQYYDTAKIHYIKTVCPFVNSRYAIVVAHLEADFLAQAHTDDHVAVQTAVTHIGTKSFTLSQRLIDTDSGEVRCEGRTIMVAFDLKTQESIDLLPEWVEAMEKYEGKKLK